MFQTPGLEHEQIVWDCDDVFEVQVGLDFQIFEEAVTRVEGVRAEPLVDFDDLFLGIAVGEAEDSEVLSQLVKVTDHVSFFHHLALGFPVQTLQIEPRVGLSVFWG